MLLVGVSPARQLFTVRPKASAARYAYGIALSIRPPRHGRNSGASGQCSSSHCVRPTENSTAHRERIVKIGGLRKKIRERRQAEKRKEGGKMKMVVNEIDSAGMKL